MTAEAKKLLGLRFVPTPQMPREWRLVTVHPWEPGWGSSKRVYIIIQALLVRLHTLALSFWFFHSSRVTFLRTTRELDCTFSALR